MHWGSALYHWTVTMHSTTHSHNNVNLSIKEIYILKKYIYLYTFFIFMWSYSVWLEFNLIIIITGYTKIMSCKFRVICHFWLTPILPFVMRSWRRRKKEVISKGKGAKKNPKCKLFPKRWGGGSTPKFTFKKVYIQWKEASNWISLTQECVLVGSEGNIKSFGTQFFFI